MENNGGDGGSVSVIEGGKKQWKHGDKETTVAVFTLAMEGNKNVQVHVCGVGGHVVDECKRNVTMTCSVP